jgi:hypothetical protein
VPRLLPRRNPGRARSSASPAATTATAPAGPTALLPPALGESPRFDDASSYRPSDVGFPLLPPADALAAPAPTLEGPRPLRLETVPDGGLDPRLAPPARLGPPFDAPGLEGPGPLDPYPRAIPEPSRRDDIPPLKPGDGRSGGPKPKGDPAEDSALRRRIEEQVRIAAGRHLRSMDVRVVDQKVTIEVRVDRFWHRRAIRRSIESLPSLVGLSAKVDVE